MGIVLFGRLAGAAGISPLSEPENGYSGDM